jgi:hypothetical protein
MKPTKKKPRLGRIPLPKKPPKVEIPKTAYKRKKKLDVDELNGEH